MLDFKNLSWYGFGYTDVCGEWYSTGGGYTYIGRDIWELNHNYYVSLRGSKAKWDLHITQGLKACNSQDIDVHYEIYKTKKAAFAEGARIIEEWDKSEETLVKMEEWKKRNAQPVFIEKDNKMELVGTCYRWSCIDDYEEYKYETGRYTYYYDEGDILNEEARSQTNIYYQLHWWGGEIHISREKNFYGGRSSEGMKDDNKLKEMLMIVKGNPKYGYLNELIDEQLEKEKVEGVI